MACSVCWRAGASRCAGCQQIRGAGRAVRGSALPSARSCALRPARARAAGSRGGGRVGGRSSGTSLPADCRLRSPNSAQSVLFRERLDRVFMLRRHVQRLAAGREQLQPRTGRNHRRQLAGPPPPPARSCRRRAGSHPGLGRAPPLPRRAAGRLSRAPRAHAQPRAAPARRPRADSGRRRPPAAVEAAANSSASRVLPTPPGPTSVSRRTSPPPSKLVQLAELLLAADQPARRHAAGSSAPPSRTSSRRRVVLEDPAFELLQFPARLQPELVTERPPRRLVGLECLRLAAATVEREHQLRRRNAPATDARRTSASSSATEPSCLAERKLGVNTSLQRRDVQLTRAAESRPARTAR